MQYRTHIQGIGWQDWCEDGEISGTVGERKRVEAIQIKIVKKQAKGKIVVSTDTNNTIFNAEGIEINGYKLANVPDTTLETYIDGEKIDSEIKYSSDAKIVSNNKGYGVETNNINPRYNIKIDVTNIETKTHSLELRLVDKEENIIATSVKTIKLDKDTLGITYKSHIQDIGWQGYVKDGEISGTTGKSKRLEAIQIKGINLPEGVELKYQAHVQDIGWQNEKKEGEIAGTINQFKRIEAIRIKLENTDKYSVQYRTHIQGIGWQDWCEDGEISGTVGERKRVEAIQIKIVDRQTKGKIEVSTDTENTVFNSEGIEINGYKLANVPDTKLETYIEGEKIDSEIKYSSDAKIVSNNKGYGVETNNINPRYNIKIDVANIETGTHGLELRLIDKEGNVIATIVKTIKLDKDTLGITYKSHIQDIGWQGYVKDGEISGTTGKSKRLEAIQIKGINLPEGVELKYQAHIQDIGWQTWKSKNENAGTIGQSKSLEGIKIKLENTDQYSIIYRAHVQDMGWQGWANDGEMSGTVGESKRIEAIEIKIVDKITEKRTKVSLDTSGTLTNETHTVSGWLMTNEQNVKLRLLIDNQEVSNQLSRRRDQSIYNRIKGYGGEELNPAPRFDTNIDFSKYSLGNHTIEIQAISENGDIIQTDRKVVNIIKKIEHYKATYGNTGLGDVLEYYRYGNGPNVLFATFCVHGFEDNWSQDGSALVDIAHQFYNRLVSMNDYGIADKWTIYIMQCVNPDGVNHGYTNNGPGRTTLRSDVGKGIDLNRCWSTGFVASYSNRNYTGSSPFLAVESRYLRDFMLSHRATNGQNVVVDLHGWTQQLIGDSVLRNYYKTQFPENTETASYGKGYLINWARANLGARAVLVELPRNNYSYNDVVNNNLANRYIEATLSMLRGL